MTKIGIVGGGRSATLHAEAAAAASGVELVGVGGRPGSAGLLADAMGVADMSLQELASRADGLVLAVPALAMADIVTALPAPLPVLVEMPMGDVGSYPGPVMTGANLLHSALAKKALRAIADLGDVHHLALRGRALRRPDADDLLNQPFAGAWPVILAAAGAAVTAVRADIEPTAANIELELADGRRVSASLHWVDTEHAARTEIEAAASTGVVSCELWPTPRLELDGTAVATTDEHPLVTLGFIEQMRRFASLCSGRGDAWPPGSVGLGVHHLTAAARTSADRQGEWLAIG